jgi:hypothetical protein
MVSFTAEPGGSGALSRTASSISPICNCVSPPAIGPTTSAGTGCPADCMRPSAARANWASAASGGEAARPAGCSKLGWIIGMICILADPG